ncbi:MAG: T9SS type A sorting domain-containing protein, partial [Bacteroidota bacterium]
NMWRTNNVKAGTPTWTQISSLSGTNAIVDLAIAPSNANVVYISRGGGSNFYRSTNAMGGSPTWTDLDASLPAGGTPRDIEIDPTDPTHLWIALGNNIYESVNSGGNWTDVSGTLPNIPLNTIVYDARSTNDALYVGMDVGVYYRDGSMADWTAFSTGIPNVEVTELEIYYDPNCAGNDMLRAGTYGRGLWESDLFDGGNTAPLACFEGAPLSICEGQTVQLTDLSAYTPTSWTWTITPATHTFVGGTNANSQNPQVQFNALGNYDIQLVATNGNGTDNATQVGYVNVTGASLSLPVSEDWETGANCGTASDCGTTVCALPNNWVNATNGSEDVIDWRIDEGGTPSGGTGPSVDFNPGTATGHYVYLEASSCFGQEAQLISPCIDLRTATNPQLTFAYHMSGGDMGELHVDVFSAGSWTLDVMTPITGDQGTAWLTNTTSLLPFVGNVVQIRFRGITGPGFTSDLSLDDIGIQEGVVLNGVDLEFTGEFLPSVGNQLSWNGENLSEVKAFVLKRRLEDGTLVEMDRQDAVPNKSAYDFLDENPKNGLNIYQLFALDLNGEMQDAGTVQILSSWAGESVTLFPNPYEGTLNLQVQGERAEQVQVRVFDLFGKQVYTSEIAVQPGMQKHTFDLHNLSPGVYFFHYKDHRVKVVKL